MDCICVKRKHKKRRDPKKFRPISPHISPVHSQPSTLGHVPEQRLPKVNSTGLWFGAPSVYATGPAPGPAYYYGRPYGNHPQHIQRASSETRLPQAIPAAHGQRIYHSQQLAPVYEMPPSSPGMEIYDVYQFAGGHSRSKLLETKHTQNFHNFHNGEFRLNSRLERSKSDAQDRPSKRHEGKRTGSKDRAPVHGSPQRQSSSKDRQSSSRDRQSSSKDRQGSSKERHGSSKERFANSQRSSHSGQSQKSQQDVRRHESHTNKGFAPDPGSTLERVAEIQQYVVSGVNGNIPSSKPSTTTPPPTSTTSSPPLPNGKAGLVSATVPSSSVGDIQSATDSMKLLAKNKTDDQKTIVPPGVVSVMVDKNGDGKDINYQHYVYQGDIYATPNKANKIISGNLNDESNPILSRMKEMVIEKNRSSAPNSPRSDSEDPVIYQEIRTTKVTRTEVETTINDDDALAGLDLPDPSELAKLKDEPVRHDVTEVTEVIRSPPATANTQELETGETTTTTSVVTRTHTELSPRGSWDGEASPEDLDTAGKRITESAFTFLDKYLSDDEGTDTHVESPPLSPTAGLRPQTVGD